MSFGKLFCQWTLLEGTEAWHSTNNGHRDTGLWNRFCDDPINARTIPTKHPAESGGVPGTSRKYYLTPAKESAEVAKLRPDCMKDGTTANAGTYPKVGDDIDKRLRRR